MPYTKEYRAHVFEKLGQVTPVTDRAMFGGVGIYSAGIFFALIDDDKLFFKVDDTNRADYEQRGMPPWSPPGPPSSSPKYYELPPDLLDDPVELSVWVDKAVAVAESNKRKK